MSFLKAFENRTPLEMTFGFYSEDHPAIKNGQGVGTLHNIANGVDWIPVAGVISGLARGIFILALAYHYNRNLPPDHEYKIWLITEGIRAAVSTLSLGFLFIAPDVLFTLQEDMTRGQPKLKRSPYIGLETIYNNKTAVLI